MENSMHWGYPTTPTSTTSHNQWIPMQTRSGGSVGSKRVMSDSDCEFSDQSSKEQISPSGGSCQMLNRKKRRGVIEKRRRDKINSSLSDLKRLVPAAFEKQGSAKLEKAEILKLTVEHLKNMSNRRMDTPLSHHESQRIAVDSYMMGFRECAAEMAIEVSRYLVTIEGMDIQDPMKLRLMTHLEYFSQQRAAAVASSHWPTSHATSTPASAGGYQPNCTSPSSYHIYPPAAPVYPPPVRSHQQPITQTTVTATIHHETNDASKAQSATISINHSQPQSPQETHSATAQQTHEQQQMHQQQQHHTYTTESQGYETATYLELTAANHQRGTHLGYGNTLAASTASAYHHQGYGPSAPTGNYGSVANNSRPYRPWGAEMAY